MSTSHPYLKELEEKRGHQEIKLAPEVNQLRRIYLIKFSFYLLKVTEKSKI